MSPSIPQPAPPEEPLESIRFAILQHDYPTLHWDIFLQEGNRLLSWRGDHHGHFLNGGLVVQTDDHRLVYLDYQGPLTGQRGTVRRIDGGALAWKHRGEHEFIAEIKGQRWQGLLRLKKIDETRWLVVFNSGLPIENNS